MSNVADQERKAGLYLFARLAKVRQEIDRKVSPGASVNRHVPVIDNMVCVGCTKSTPGSTWDTTADIQLTANNEVATIGLSGFQTPRRILNGLVTVRPVSVRLYGHQPEIPAEAPFDGFVSQVTAAGEMSLRGLKGDTEIELPQFDFNVVDSFTIACIGGARTRLPLNPARAEQ